MSRETAEARAARRAAADDMVAHRKICAQCRTAIRARKWDKLCDQGFVLRDDLRLASVNLAEQQQLDARPVPGQMMLLDGCTCGGVGATGIHAAPCAWAALR